MNKSSTERVADYFMGGLLQKSEPNLLEELTNFQYTLVRAQEWLATITHAAFELQSVLDRNVERGVTRESHPVNTFKVLWGRDGDITGFKGSRSGFEAVAFLSPTLRNLYVEERYKSVCSCGARYSDCEHVLALFAEGKHWMTNTLSKGSAQNREALKRT